MLKRRIVGIGLMLLVATQVKAQGDYASRARSYVEQYKAMAIAEQKRSGVPAAITLAQGIHETSAGASELATNANNHFGIKCKKNWTGDKYAYTDDAPDECFRKYTSAIESYKDHSDYLSTSQRYASLFKLSPTDYAAWAIGLRKAGYATNPRYAQILIKLVEDFRLQEYTYAALDNNMLDKVAEVVPVEDAKPKEPEPWAKESGNIKIAEMTPETPAMRVDKPESFPPYGQLVKVNGLKAVYAKKGDMPLEHAINHNIRYEKLLEINEIADRPLQANMYLYLERKRFKGLAPTHVVKPGETIAKVAQYEGMQLKSLRALNLLQEGEEPAEGSVLYLQVDAPAKPVLSGTAVAQVTTPAEIVAQPEPQQEPPAPAAELQYVATGNKETTEPEVQYAVVNNTAEANTIPSQTKEIGPTPAPEVVTQTAAQPVATEPAGIKLPPPPPEVAKKEPEDNGRVGVNPPVNIANEKSVEEQMAAEKAKGKTGDEPNDELAALKAKFDRVVYAPKKTPAVTPATTPVSEPIVQTPVVEEPVAKVEEPKAETKPAPAGAKFYTVKKGDTAFAIAKRNNITVKELMDWNNLDFGGIKVGQKLRVKQ